MRWGYFLPLFSIALAWDGSSAAQPAGVPVYVAVHGTGKIRARLASGITAPCDASSNIPLFDGELRANETIELRAAGWSVCEEHTSGAFRGSAWSTPRIVGPRCLRWMGRRCAVHEGFIRLDLSTD